MVSKGIGKSGIRGGDGSVSSNPWTGVRSVKVVTGDGSDTKVVYVTSGGRGGKKTRGGFSMSDSGCTSGER